MELRGVAAELGLKMGKVALNNMVKDLDLNGDGQISPDEFSLWWLAGRKGATGAMSQLLAAKLGANKFFEGLSGSMKAMAE